MQNVVGLIVEYNPLHNGHLYHFEQAKKITTADASVIVMSGNFLQRGEPALVNKWARARMALEMGADLVVELPYAYATQQAQYFALGAISILHHLPFVTHLCFGSESGNLTDLQAISKILTEEPAIFQENLKKEMKKGSSYPKAYGLALKHLAQELGLAQELFAQPNNILGLHYLLALKHLNSSIQPTTIKREKAGYHDRSFTDSSIASATSIRKALFSTTSPVWSQIAAYVPKFTLDILQEEWQAQRGPISWEHFFSYLEYTFSAHTPEQLSDIYEMEEGIEYRFLQKMREAKSVQELCSLVKSKRYTWNRLQRMMLHAFTQFTKQKAKSLRLNQGVPYIRLLGFSTKGRSLLQQAKKEIALPIISRIAKRRNAMLDVDVKVAELYTLASPAHIRACEKKREFSQPPLIYP